MKLPKIIYAELYYTLDLVYSSYFDIFAHLLLLVCFLIKMEGINMFFDTVNNMTCMAMFILLTPRIKLETYKYNEFMKRSMALSFVMFVYWDKTRSNKIVFIPVRRLM